MAPGLSPGDPLGVVPSQGYTTLLVVAASQRQTHPARSPVKFLRACYNPRVIVALVAVAVGVFLVAPGAIVVAAPFLFLAICPLSMLVMMRTMGGMEKMDRPQASEPAGAPALAPSAVPAEPAAALRMQLAAARAEQQRLADELARLEHEADPVPDAASPLAEMGHRAAEAG